MTAAAALAVWPPVLIRDPSLRNASRSRTRMKCHGWGLDALAVRCAASTTRRKTASGTSLSWHSRTAMTVRAASQTWFAIGAIVLALCAEMDEPNPAERHYERRISRKAHRADYPSA